MFSIFSTTELSAPDAARLRRVEQKLDLILKHLGLDAGDLALNGELPEEIRTLADAGRKIEAIKAHRERYGSGLTDAKDAIEAYLRSR